ncbi:hypothetical protein ABMA27_011149 [Loxostege sticticalis]|uniref:Uncharacterized protein n=1 Tax=Loxostege sticticalis TaxID=481309 RepID=A0ABR3H3G3_LOXSC
MEILEILGEDPSQAKLYGKDIQQDLAIRMQHIATNGLSKEARKELLDRYLPPANCALIDAPTLNPEVAYAITDAIQKRDKGLVSRQKQQASALSCLGEALTQLMASDAKNTGLIKLLMDAVKLISDNQATDSNIRRSFILNGLKKNLKDQLQATKIDKMLFGEQLVDTLKAAKAISRSGSDMKPAPVRQPAAKKPPHNLNWRAPPQSQRPKGTQRKEPFPHKDRPASSSKRSSRPAKSRSHNYR